MIDFDNSKKLYFSIKEVAIHFGINESTLRFWETEFKEVAPRKSAGGVRQYTRLDIDQIAIVYHLLKEKKLSIEGAKQVLSTKKDEETRRQEILKRLEGIKKELNDLMGAFD
ncbi:MerR family transcriptional regulator [Dysgonomonas sp. 520]|uniref:MerR family transcriptional regulator n=1 Tax=Dysgonomonas sp. 520 TaxID=2302931 RepID=UPI0013D2F324|nr:MerR family transcriptional regulator [Dysgonomonas sp. 520]NDW10017.1 MerR family transcriptional regulator [Dysgonomonas sp. 520]